MTSMIYMTPTEKLAILFKGRELRTRVAIIELLRMFRNQERLIAEGHKNGIDVLPVRQREIYPALKNRLENIDLTCPSEDHMKRIYFQMIRLVIIKKVNVNKQRRGKRAGEGSQAWERDGGIPTHYRLDNKFLEYMVSGIEFQKHIHGPLTRLVVHHLSSTDEIFTMYGTALFSKGDDHMIFEKSKRAWLAMKMIGEGHLILEEVYREHLLDNRIKKTDKYFVLAMTGYPFDIVLPTDKNIDYKVRLKDRKSFDELCQPVDSLIKTMVNQFAEDDKNNEKYLSSYHLQSIDQRS